MGWPPSPSAPPAFLGWVQPPIPPRAHLRTSLATTFSLNRADSLLIFASIHRHSEQHQGSDFLKQLFQYQLPSCIAVQGGGTEGYVVNKAYIMEERLKQEKLLQIVENLKRENAKLKNSSA